MLRLQEALSLSRMPRHVLFQEYLSTGGYGVTRIPTELNNRLCDCRALLKGSGTLPIAPNLWREVLRIEEDAVDAYAAIAALFALLAQRFYSIAEVPAEVLHLFLKGGGEAPPPPYASLFAMAGRLSWPAARIRQLSEEAGALGCELEALMCWDPELVKVLPQDLETPVREARQHKLETYLTSLEQVVRVLEEDAEYTRTGPSALFQARMIHLRGQIAGMLLDEPTDLNVRSRLQDVRRRLKRW